MTKIKIFCGILLLMSGFVSLASGEDRNVAIDQTIGGMEQGRRIQSPGSYNNKGITSGQPGSATTPAQDIHTISQGSENTASSQGKNISSGADRLPSGGENHGFVNGGSNNQDRQNGGTNQAGREQTNGSTNANTSTVTSGQAGQGSTGQENGSANSGSSQAGTEQSNGSANVNAGGLSTQQQPSGSVTVNTGETISVETPGNGGVLVGGGTSPTGQTGTGEINTGSSNSGTSPEESSGTSNNPIVGVEVGVDQNSGTVNAGVQVDTSGQLEDRQILDAGVTGTGTGSSQTQVGSATEITGQEAVHQTDVTTQPVTQTTEQIGTTIPSTTETNTGTGNGGILPGGSSGTTTQEPSETSGNPIVDVDANVNPNSGTADVNVGVDTSGELEDRQIIDADVTGEGIGSTGTETGSASEITGSETIHQTDVTTQPVTDVTGQIGAGETTSLPAVQAGVETQGNGGILTGGATSSTGQIEMGEINAGTGSSGTSTEESSGTSGNPIVDVEAGIDQNSGIPNTEVVVDTSGELEEREILDADLTGETTGSTGAEVGSATDITDADLVEESDITTEVVDGPAPDQISGSTTGETSSASQTSSESPDASSNPIIDLETNINPESGTVEAGVNLDTSGELEDRQILDLDLAAEGAGSAGTDIGSASSITGSETVHDTNVTTTQVTTAEQTVSTTTEAQTGTGTVSSETQIGGAVESLIPAPSDFGTDIDTTGQTSGGVVDVGIAAEIDGVGEGADEASDPADGLSPSVPGL